MRKIPTLYRRDPENRGRVTGELAVVLPSYAVATPKWDGTALLFSGGWWARREVKAGRVAPATFILAEEDTVTGKRFGWVPVLHDDPQWKWHAAAISALPTTPEPGTYEAVGPHFQGNPHRLDSDMLKRHGQLIIPNSPLLGGQDALIMFLEWLPFEGVVWWADGQPVAKIKRRDFGLDWPTPDGGLCGEADHRGRMTDDEFWEHVFNRTSPEPDDEFTDVAPDVRMCADPCPECGSTNACAWDDQGRPLIHAITDEEGTT